MVSKARRYLAAYENMAEMIKLGAYRKGANKEVDEAITYYTPMEDFLRQGKNERVDLQNGYVKLAQILGMQWGS